MGLGVRVCEKEVHPGLSALNLRFGSPFCVNDIYGAKGVASSVRFSSQVGVF